MTRIIAARLGLVHPGRMIQSSVSSSVAMAEGLNAGSVPQSATPVAVVVLKGANGVMPSSSNNTVVASTSSSAESKQVEMNAVASQTVAHTLTQHSSVLLLPFFMTQQAGVWSVGVSAQPAGSPVSLSPGATVLATVSPSRKQSESSEDSKQVRKGLRGQCVRALGWSLSTAAASELDSFFSRRRG